MPVYFIQRSGAGGAGQKLAHESPRPASAHIPAGRRLTMRHLRATTLHGWLVLTISPAVRWWARAVAFGVALVVGGAALGVVLYLGAEAVIRWIAA